MKKLLVSGFLCVFLSMSAGAADIMIDGQSMDVPVCGGFPGLVCSDSEWCDYPESAPCGLVDQFGVCRPRPDFCPEVYIPVCGCDGETYGNFCDAARNGVDVASEGECRSGS